jgi:hypothetical protein
MKKKEYTRQLLVFIPIKVNKQMSIVVKRLMFYCFDTFSIQEMRNWLWLLLISRLSGAETILCA